MSWAVFAGNMKADEGMWLLPLIEKMNGKAIHEAGCELTPKQIYDINHTSLKDAIVQFGGGCTGEIISPNGLLVTNHHCGYSNIQKLSSVEHDYLKDGYWAMNNNEELPCEGLTVKFLESMSDVTSIIAKAKKDGEEAVKETIARLEKEAQQANPHCTAIVTSFYDTNVYYLIIYRVYRDVRFVGAPPSSIGKFGADTDNWMWPRHTGDFSMFRVYSAPDGTPADYSPENIPLQAKNHLKISLAGVQEGDYTMIMGYPGRTTRFQTSPELKFQIEQNDVRIAARTLRQSVLLEDMLADPKVKIQYASKYSGSSNGWKKWQGMKLAFGKLGIIARAEQEEAEFQKWVDASKKRQAKYGTALADLESTVESGREINLASTLATESIYKIELPVMAATMRNAFKNNLKTMTDTTEALMAAYDRMHRDYKDYSASTDRKVAKAMLRFYRDNASPTNYPTGLGEDFATMDIDTYLDALYDASVFCSPETLKKAIEQKGVKVFEDPAFVAAKSLVNKTFDLHHAAGETNKVLADARQNYTAGLLEWKAGQPSYPDANFTMRFTYGTVKGYSPKDAVVYRYYTTLDGVMEKEDPTKWEFVVPAKLKELWKNQDFGQYAMADGKMPLAFLSNNDITGGNSGSPIMNSRGELIGLAFDGNWESMSSDVMFEPELQRCINVDIRYVLFIVDKFGGAGWLIDEMDIVR